jgi:hypothetical protein
MFPFTSDVAGVVPGLALHEEYTFFGGLRGHATISNCYPKQRLEQPLNVGGRWYSARMSSGFRNVFKSRLRVHFKPFVGGHEPAPTICKYRAPYPAFRSAAPGRSRPLI